MDNVPGISAKNLHPLPEISGGQAEILVSVAIIADVAAETVAQAAEAALQVLKDNFRFYELLIVSSASYHSANKPKFADLLGRRNLRFLILRDWVGEYRAAVMAASETIGDVVLIMSAGEFSELDLKALLDEAIESGGSVLLRRPGRVGVFARMSGRLLSAVSDYDVDPRLMRSSVHQRAWLSRIVGRADSEVALRFMPRGGHSDAKVRIVTIDPQRSERRRFSLMRRAGLASEVLANASPRMLRVLAGLSLLVMTSSVLFFLYAVTLYLIGFDLQPGWLTISLAISGSTAFLSFALGAIATAMYQILNYLREDGGDEIQDEIDNTDLFKEFRQVNVETLDEG